MIVLPTSVLMRGGICAAGQEDGTLAEAQLIGLRLGPGHLMGCIQRVQIVQKNEVAARQRRGQDNLALEHIQPGSMPAQPFCGARDAMPESATGL